MQERGGQRAATVPRHGELSLLPYIESGTAGMSVGGGQQHAREARRGIDDRDLEENGRNASGNGWEASGFRGRREEGVASPDGLACACI